MKKILLFNLLLVGIQVIFFPGLQAQVSADSVLVKVETRDGNEFVGTILEDNDSLVRLNATGFRELIIRKDYIKEIKVLKRTKLVEGRYWLPQPQSARYFWAPNGYGLKRGEVYYQNVWVFYNQFSAGVTDYFSLGGGMMPLFLLGGAPTPVWIVPKFSIPVIEDKLNVGVGSLLGVVLGDENPAFGILYGTATVGSQDKNVSFGMGYGFADESWTRAPVFNISAMIRTGPRGYFLTENYLLPTGDSNTLLLSAGGRSIFKKAGIDFGLFLPLNSELGEFIAFPWLGVTIFMGKYKKGAY
jgi:hypothetical protein